MDVPGQLQRALALPGDTQVTQNPVAATKSPAPTGKSTGVRDTGGSCVYAQGGSGTGRVILSATCLNRALIPQPGFEGICDQRTAFLKVSLPHRYRAAREELLVSPAAAVVSRYTKEIQSLWTRKRK